MPVRPVRALLAASLLALLGAATVGPAARTATPRPVTRRAFAAQTSLRPTDSAADATRYFLEQRGARTADALAASYAAARRTSGGFRPRTMSSGTPWQYLGPGNIGGRTRAIAVDPVTPAVIYAGGVAGGVWKSSDGGASWAPLTDSLPNVAVTSLVIDPSNHQTIYAGTGEFFASLHNGIPGGGVFKSTNSGASWTALSSTSGTSFRFVNKLAMSADGRLYAATWFGASVSVDGGATWTTLYTSLLASDGCMDIDVAPTIAKPNAVVAACGGFEGDGIYRAADGDAASWTKVVLANVAGVDDFGVADIAVAPSDPLRLYASLAASYTATLPGAGLAILKSIDGGATWTNTGTTSSANWLDNCLYPGSPQGDYDNAIAVDPVDPNRFWVGGIDLWVSSDSGATLKRAASWFLGQTDPAHPARYAHADQHAIVFAPGYNGTTNQTVYFGNDGGLFRTANGAAAITADVTCDAQITDPAGAFTFTDLNNGYGVTQFYDGVPEPDGSGYFGGTQDNGTLYNVATDGPNDWFETIGGDGGFVGIDPDAAHGGQNYTYYTSLPRADIHRSVNGSNFVPAASGLYSGSVPNDRFLFVAPLAVDRSQHGRVWTGGEKVWRTTNSGASWIAVTPDIDGVEDEGRISAIAIKPGSPNVVYVGTERGDVFRTTSGSSGLPSFTQVAPAELPPGGNANSVGEIAIGPDGSVVIGYQNVGDPGVWRSANGTSGFTQASGLPSVPVNTVAIDPVQPTQVYAGTDTGVYESTNGGATFVSATNNLANTLVARLAFQPGTQTLYAFTHGRGVWRAASGDGARPTFTTSGPTTTTSGIRVIFSEPVTGVSSSSLVLRKHGSTTNIATPSSCTSNGTTPVSCSGTVRTAMLVASLVPGQQYDVLASSPAIKDATANTLATTSKLVRGPLSIQDTDVAVKQGWATVSSSFAYGKSYRSARISGATAQFTSTSRTFTINTVNGPGGGAANVYVGTVKVGTLATSAGATSHGAKTITLPGTVPTASSYAVRIVVSGTTSTGVRFDAVKIGSAARNDTPTATYTWSPISLSSTLHTIVHDLGTATAALRFKSTRVTATFVRSASSGKVTVSIDGVTKGTYDLYAGSTTPNYALSWSGLNGTVEHVITLKVTGTHRAGATGNKVFLDRMSVA